MATECYSQLGLDSNPNSSSILRAARSRRMPGCCSFANSMSSSASARTCVSRITDARDPRYVTHDLDAPVRQRLYQIAAGYEDVNDADRLRHDPTFQVVAADGRTTLGSQPTLSRLENAIDWSAIQRLARTGVDWFCAYAYGPNEHPADLILDLDSTDDPTHGTQQLALFHGCSTTSTCITRSSGSKAARDSCCGRGCVPGRDPSATGGRRRAPAPAAAAAPPVSAHADLPARRRGMATPGRRSEAGSRGHPATCWASARIASSRRAWRRLVAHAQARYDATRAARAHPHQLSASREVVAPSPADPRQDRCHRRGPQCPLHGHQSARPRRRSRRVVRRPGHVGEWIKELKLDIHADRLSCHRFRANAVPPAAAQSRAVAAGATSVARSSRARDWRRRPSARFVSTCSKSRGASSAASDVSGFISRRIGPANRSSRAVIARSRARQPNDVTRASFFDGSAATAGGVITRALGWRVRPSEGPPRALTTSATTVFDLARVVTAGDGAVADSFVNNAGRAGRGRPSASGEWMTMSRPWDGDGIHDVSVRRSCLSSAPAVLPWPTFLI